MSHFTTAAKNSIPRKGPPGTIASRGATAAAAGREPIKIHAAPLCAAPWLTAILAISLVGILTEDISLVPLLRSFAFALLVAGPIGFAVSHFTARAMAAGRRDRIFPALVGTLLFTAIAALTLGIGLYFVITGPQSSHAATSWLSRVSGVVLQLYLAMNFVMVSFLAVFRKIRSLTFITLFSFAVGFAAAAWGARWLFEAGVLIGFAIGQIVFFICLIRLALHEFGRGSGAFATWEITSILRRHWKTALCGFFLILGVFADKFIPFPVAPDWKIPTVALLSIAPGITWFFLHLRTDFTPALQTFADTMGRGEPLGTIRHAKDELLHAFRHGFTQVLVVQSMVTAAFLFWADAVSVPFPFFVAGKDTLLFRVALVGAFLFVIYLNLLSVLLNLNAINSAFRATAVFAIVNLIFSAMTHFLSPEWQGFGFVIASGAALLIAVFAVNGRLANLEFWEWREP